MMCCFLKHQILRNKVKTRGIPHCGRHTGLGHTIHTPGAPFRLRGAMAARLTPDQKAACSSHVGVKFFPFTFCFQDNEVFDFKESYMPCMAQNNPHVFKFQVTSASICFSTLILSSFERDQNCLLFDQSHPRIWKCFRMVCFQALLLF